MKSIVLVAALASVTTVAIAQQPLPSWTGTPPLTGDWDCVQGCDPNTEEQDAGPTVDAIFEC
jgi:hypothetical protein